MLTRLLDMLVADAALFAAVVGVPWQLARLALPRAGATTTGAVSGALATTLAVAVTVALHALRIPIERVTLATPYLALFAAVTLLRLAVRCPLATREPLSRASTACLLAFAVMVFPLTCLAGVDTYKWQVLANSVRVDACIPWLVHPVSLLGFTPRAYPSAQPLLLATVQILGNLGVEAGFYILSLLVGYTGFCAAHVLGRRVLPSPRAADWFAAFYVFSPVFVRYAHWATGRGLFLALFPLFLVALLDWPRLRAWLTIPLASLLIALTHKAGLVAIALTIPACAASCLLPRTRSRIIPVLLALPVLAAALLLTPPSALPPTLGQALNAARTAMTRFGWMVPGAALGLLGARAWLADPPRRRLFPALLITFPLAFPRDMYGALLALPFVTLAATVGFSWLQGARPRFARVIAILASALTLTGALAIVVHRDLTATPRRIRHAAEFLESYDPRGPYEVFAPGRARVRIHAYVSGCPRFVVAPATNALVTVRRPPPLRGPPAEVVADWIDFGRNLLELGDVDVAWYGHDPRAYYVVIDGEGDRPADGGERLYDAEGITILKPRDQPRPY